MRSAPGPWILHTGRTAVAFTSILVRHCVCDDLTDIQDGRFLGNRPPRGLKEQATKRSRLQG